MKIDITTEDEIVPGRIEYRYPLMFEEGSVRVLSYLLETVLAEKLETVVSRGIANTRGRDYYDIHTLLRLKAGEINRDSLHEAVVATASRRGSLGTMGDYEAVLGEVRRSDMMRGSGPLTSGITLCGRPQDEGEAKQDAFKYIELYYSRQRMRSSIGYNAPCDLERDVA